MKLPAVSEDVPVPLSDRSRSETGAQGPSGWLCNGGWVEYAVYIVLPLGDDADRISAAAVAAAPDEFDFRIRTKSDPSESADAELHFRVRGVENGQEALVRALQIYEGGRAGAGMPPDERIRVSLEPAPERVPDSIAPSDEK
jgi:hypothetical protein